MAWTLNDMKTYVTQMIGNDQVDDLITNWTNLGQRHICSYRNFWFMQDYEEVTVASSDSCRYVISLPTDFKQPLALIDKTNDNYLEYTQFQELRRNDPSDITSDDADKWSIWDSKIYLDKEPDDTTDYRLYYYRNPNDLVDGSDTLDIPDQFAHVLVDYVTAKGCMFERRNSEASDYMTLHSAGMKELIKECRRNIAYIHQSLNMIRDKGFKYYARNRNPLDPLSINRA